MEPPPPFYHRHRYVPPPPENPNFYNPRHDHRLPPRPPPPPPPAPLPPLPPPPLPHHLSHPRPPLPLPLPPPTPPPSQFSYRLHHYPVQDRPALAPPVAGQYSSNFIPLHILRQPHHLSPHRDPPRQNRQRNLPFYEKNSNFVDRWADLPLPPRVPTEPPFHQQQRRPLSPILPPRIDNYVSDYEHNFRFRDEAFRDHGNRENHLWGGRKGGKFDVPDYVDDDKYSYSSVRDGFERNSSSGFERDVHRMKRDIVTAASQGIDMVLSPPRDFALNVRSYDSYNDRNEDLRWGYSRLGNDNEYIDGDGVLLSSHGTRRKMVDGSYDDVDGLNSKMVGHGVQEFLDRSPRKKQVQKKSALLRIQVGKANNKINYRNRSHDSGRFSRGSYDEANLSVNSSFRGKEKDVFVDHEAKMDGDREKSPVELDVSFKSNALVAKAIKAPSSSVAELESNSPGNRKPKKISLSDFSLTKLNEDSVKPSSSSCPSSSSDKYQEELKEKIVSFKIDSSTGGLDCPSRYYKHKKEPEEKVINGETNSYAPRNYFLSGSDKDMGQLAEKISVSDNGANFVVGKTGGKDSVKSVSVKRVAPDGVLLQRARKRKSVTSSLQHDVSMQSVGVNNELSDLDISSTGSLPATSQQEEGVTLLRDRISLAGIDATNDIVSSSFVNELSVEKMKIASEDVVSDSKEDGISICSSLPLSLECSALKSVPPNPGDTAPHRVPDHAGNLIHNELLRLSSDRGLMESQNLSEVQDSKNTTATFQIPNVDDSCKHPFLNESLPVESSLVTKARISVDSNAGLPSLKENKVHYYHIDIRTSNHDTLHASNFDQAFGKSPGNIIVADVASGNAGPEESCQILVNKVSNEIDINIGSPDANPSVSHVDTLASPKLDETLVCEGAGNQYLSNNSPACCSTDLANSLGDTTLSDSGFLDHSSKSIFDGATTLPGTASVEISPTSMFFNSAVVGRKRKATEGQLDVHVVKASKIAGSVVCSADDQVESLILEAKNLVSVGKEIVHEYGGKTLGRDCFEEGLSVFNNQVKGGESGEEFSLVLTSPVLSEVNPATNGATTSSMSAEPSSNIEKARTQTAYRVTDSCQDETNFTGLSSYSETSVILLQDNSVAGESNEGGTKKLDHETSYQPNQEAGINDKAPMVFSPSDLQFNNCLHSVGCQGNLVGPDTNQKQSLGNTDGANYLPLMENLAASSDNVPSCATSSTDRQIDSLPDTLLNMDSPEDVMSNFSSDMFNNTSKMNQVSHSYQGKDNMSTNNPIFVGDETSFSLKPSLHGSEIGRKSGDTVVPDLAISTKAASSLFWNSSKVTQNINPSLKKSSLIGNRLNLSVIKAIPCQMSAKYPSAVKVAPFNHIVKPRTWHRTLNASSSVVEPKSQGDCIHTQINSKKDVSKVQSSYVRRGNSLVRKLPPVAAIPQVLPSQSSVHHLNSGNNNERNGGGSDIDTVKPTSSATFGGSNGCPERLKTPPIAGSIKSLSCTSSNLVDSAYLPLVDPPRDYSPGETNDPFKSAEDTETKRSSEENQKSSKADGCETGSSNYLDCRSTGDDGNSGKKILYVKRKSNQLVAASNCHDAEKSQLLSSDGYFKRRKHQLIRTSLNEGVKQRAVMLDKSLSLQQQDSQNNIQIRSSSKKPSGCMKRKFSLVWTLHGTLTPRKDGSSGRWQRARPYLFPWKRASWWMNNMHCLSSFPNDSLSICQKLLLSRKREAIYKRSVSGFSLRRSKVLGVGGRNLKWSKSIEKNSRKANREATRAVAAAEKQKKAQNLASFTLFKSRNYVSRKSGHSIDLHPGERIFRIGSERYKMDPTRRTLQRISDEQNSTSDDQSEKKKKKFYVPRRLLIGNDEYVRIGNGNQLVRDPKRRTRILANEKVRWSLHTARLRLARKKKYCQFFTRFGKCNKDDKKCPYIHDPSKIAVCTKFLNGSCSNSNCKLTHKVIPERMQDCSYFLQGLCSNENCPYRHVNVNPKSPVCEGFLRGYCADGNECRKKHTHVCPVFEATGSCPQGPECKLHHPKKKRKGMKWKTSNLQKNTRGRYFGSEHIDVADCRTMVCETVTGKGDNSILVEERFGDYISLDVRIGENELAFEMRSKPVTDWEGPSDVEIAEADELTKPIRIMNKNLTIDSSPELDSSNE